MQAHLTTLKIMPRSRYARRTFSGTSPRGGQSALLPDALPAAHSRHCCAAVTPIHVPHFPIGTQNDPRRKIHPFYLPEAATGKKLLLSSSLSKIQADGGQLTSLIHYPRRIREPPQPKNAHRGGANRNTILAKSKDSSRDMSLPVFFQPHPHTSALLQNIARFSSFSLRLSTARWSHKNVIQPRRPPFSFFLSSWLRGPCEEAVAATVE
nr:uncharacterized protein LOC131763768 [Kogia breviceps]